MKFVFKENVLRVALIASSFLFSMLSLALIALGVVYYNDLKPIKLYIVNVSFYYLPIVLIVLGCLSFITALIGCYIVTHHNKIITRLLVATLIILLVADLTLSCIAFMNVSENVRNSTNKLLEKELINNNHHFTKLEERVSF